MVFGPKKNKDKYARSLYPQNSAQLRAHRVFQFGAMCLIGLVFYEIFVAEEAIKKNQNVNVTKLECNEEEINKRANTAFQEMLNSPHYKEITEFVDYVESNADKKDGNILQTQDGYLLYVPFSKIATISQNEDKQNSIPLSNDQIDFDINFEAKVIGKIKNDETQIEQGNNLEQNIKEESNGESDSGHNFEELKSLENNKNENIKDENIKEESGVSESENQNLKELDKAQQ
jgi:hypothetical protein